jgi:hypothetical protein
MSLMTGRWPNLLIIGAHKAGTTSLHRYLSVHPDIQMSSEKELAYFVGPSDSITRASRWELGADWYRSNFAGPGSVHGESSTAYTNYPFTSGVPGRIYDAIPDVKLLSAVRDPVDRFVSHYLHVCGLGRERRRLGDILSSPALHNSAYMLRSRYWYQLSQFLQCFPPEQIHVVGLEDLRDRRTETMAELFRFLDVADDVESTAWTEVHNVSHRFPLMELFGRFADEDTVYDWSNNRRGFRRILRSVRRRQKPKPRVPEGLWDEAKAVFSKEADQLREFSGRSFSQWSI